MKEPSIHVECKAYAAGSGRVYENGKGRKGGSDIGDGSTVTITRVIIGGKSLVMYWGFQP